MIDERELIAKIAKKDQNAFQTFFYIYKNRLYYYFYKLLENQEDAEELTMETFFRIYRNAGTFRGESKVSSWVFGIARRVCLEHLKEKNKSIKTLELYEGDAVSEGSPINEDVELVRKAIEKLAPYEREVLFLAYYEELPYEDIAKVLDIPVGTVKSRVFNAKAKLKRIIEEMSHERG
jgi:RNA polymerase sigma-70 factor (ECF subfamily)